MPRPGTVSVGCRGRLRSAGGSRPGRIAGDRWWVLALLLGFAVAVSALAYPLAARRDFATGASAGSTGPRHRSRGLRNPLALAWRLQRGTLLAWAAAFAVIGVVVGGMASSVGAFLDTPQAKDFIAKLGGEQGV